MMISLPACLSTEILQNLLIKCGLYSKPSTVCSRIRSHEVISLSGACMSTTCPWGCFFGIMSHRSEIFCWLFLSMLCAMISCVVSVLQPRHLLGMPGIRYHRVIPLPECFGYRLSVRPVKALHPMEAGGEGSLPLEIPYRQQ